MIIYAFIASVAALLGGYFAIKHRDKLNHTLGLTAGIILGLVAFDLLPEIFELVESTGIDPVYPMIALVIGFLGFHVIEKVILIHSSHESDYGQHHHPHVGTAGAIALSGHSFLDGASIGLAFQVNSTVGATVAIAVIGHRFADGFNTTNVMVLHKNTVSKAKRMLVIASFMPILGAISTLFFGLSDNILAIYLGFFAGFLLYIGASDILPQAHSKSSSKITIGLTVFGAVFMFVVTRFA